MLDYSIFLVLGLMIFASASYVLVKSSRDNKQLISSSTEMQGKWDEILEKLDKGTDRTSAEIIERLVSIERRQTNLEKDVVDRMKVVAQRERRISAMQGDDDEQPTPEQLEMGRAQLAAAAGAQNGEIQTNEEDQLDYVRQLIRGR